MTTDNYAPCPCGSGKKMKFCKCVDQPQEYDRIMRLIEGGQELAALDRTNQLLAKTPNAAWLLAIKGELALALEETEVFKETALRFSKLKPDNPLALIMRSIVSLMDQEPLENAARYLLEGLAESRESINGLVLTALQLFTGALAQTPKAPLRFYWIQLLQELQSKMDQQMRPVEGSSDGSLLTIASTLLLPDPAGAAWGERLKEVLALKSAFRFAQAETKLRAILRDYPDQPGPLSHLLAVQNVLLEQDSAVITARKLSTLRDLNAADRDYFAALALELEPNNPSLHVPSIFKYCEIRSEEESTQGLLSLGFVEAIPDDYSNAMRHIYAASIEDEVPAKTAYNVLVTLEETGDESRVVGAVGSVLLFGKQTDKPPRAIVTMYDLPGYREIAQQIYDALGIVKDLPDPTPSRDHHYMHILERGRFRRKGKDVNVDVLPVAEQSKYVVEDFLAIRFATLGGQTLLEAVEDEPKRAAVRAVLTHLEAAHTLLREAGTMEAIYQRLQLDVPRTQVPEQIEQFQPRTLLELTRIDVKAVKTQNLVRLFSSVIALDIRCTAYQMAREVLSRTGEEMPEAARSAALEIIAGTTSDFDEALALLEQLEQSLIRQKKPAGRITLQRMNMLGSAGREEEARAVIENGLRNNPEDPYLISFLQYINQQASMRAAGGGSVDDRQLLNRMVRQRADAPEAAEPSSGLVLPGQESSGGSSGKLWLPGT